MKNKILLLSKIICAAGIVLLMAGDAKAGVVLNFTGANAHEAAVDIGTLAAITEPADMAVITSLSYTVSGLTIDTDGVANDTATFTVPISPVGGGAINHDRNFDNDTGLDGIREFDFNNGTFSAGEGISFGAITVSGTGSGGQGYQLDSALFTEITARRFGAAEEFSIAGDTTNATNTGDNSFVLNDTAFTARQVSGSFNFTDVDFTVEVSSVPEPTSFMMFLAGLGMLNMRRRRV